MKINEVNPNPQLQEAGEIVQQMYHKKHQIMDWDADTKPTIRGLVSELDDPFLLSLTKDLEYFIHYGQAWLDLDPNDIWLDESLVPDVDDMMKDPAYYTAKKSTVYEIETMRPTMYAIHAKHGFQMGEHNPGHQTFNPEAELVHEYALKVLGGSKMPLPYLKYGLVQTKFKTTVVDEYTQFGQEGRHRAKVAEILGATSMPCIIIASVLPPTEDKFTLRDFSGKIFDQFN